MATDLKKELQTSIDTNHQLQAELASRTQTVQQISSFLDQSKNELQNVREQCKQYQQKNEEQQKRISELEANLNDTAEHEGRLNVSVVESQQQIQDMKHSLDDSIHRVQGKRLRQS